MPGHAEDRMAVLFAVAGGDVLAVVPGDLLEAVADPKDWNLQEGGFVSFVGSSGGSMHLYLKFKHGRINVWCIRIIDRIWRARENHTLRLPRQIYEFLGAREHLSVDIELTKTTGNQVTVLRPNGKISKSARNKAPTRGRNKPKIKNLITPNYIIRYAPCTQSKGIKYQNRIE